MTEKERVFWCKYADFILSRNVSGRAAEACIRHAQRFAYNLGGVHLRDVDKAFLTAHFDELGRCDNIMVSGIVHFAGLARPGPSLTVRQAEQHGDRRIPNPLPGL